MKPNAALLALCLLAVPALGAGPVEALRGSSKALRDQVTALRSEQLSRRTELSALSAQIEALKAKSKGRLLPGGELDAALKQSQELSGVLTDLAQRMSAREAELESAHLALLEALSGELARLRADFDRQTDRGARRGLITAMRKVRSEREQVRAALPATRVPTLDALRPSDDPEELLEQADLLRDNEEKLTKELKALDARIAERKEEAELDKRVQRFLGEESMFDDQDRRLRVQRTTTLTAEPPKTQETGGPPPPALGAGTNQDTAGSFNSPPGGLAPMAGAPAPDTRNTGPALGDGLDVGSVRVTNGSDARPQVGQGAAIATGDNDDTADLEVQRRKLKGLADELKRKAAELEKRAAQLK